MTPHRSGAADDGSVLIMALAFLSLFGLAVAAVLGFAETGFRTADSVHRTVETQYAADAAVEGAINAIRGDVSVGRQGVTNACFSLPAEVNATAVTVECTGRTGSGVTTGGAGGGAVPASSILTLPTSAAEGVVLSTGAAPLVSGNVLTNQTRAVPAGSTLAVQGSLTCRAATGTGTVTATTTSCPAAIAPGAADPAYAAAISNAPAPATMPACPAGATATFSPGWYQSATALNALMNGTCANKRFHFTAGVYYFEFSNAGTHEWLVNDATAEVVGGTLTASAFPSRCDLAAAGVQFIFGADSRLAVTAGTLELCPPLSAGQRIAVYGVPTTTSALTGTPTLAATTAVNLGPQNFTTPTAGAAVGEGADAGLSCNNCSGTLRLTGYPAALVPANAVINTAVMRVTHDRQSAYVGTFSARVDAVDGTFATYALAAPCVRTCAAGATVESVNVLSQVSTPAKANGLSVRYTATDSPGGGAGQVWLDGIVVDITYTIPPLTASSGCLLVAPYGPASPTTCAVLRGAGTATSRMAVKGTVYAPKAPVDLSMTGQLGEVTQRGIVARTLQLGLTPGSGYAGPLVAMPGSSDRAVLLTASVAGVPALRADVTFGDGLGSTPGAAVDVIRWSVLR